jgi:hypothetical protein
MAQPAFRIGFTPGHAGFLIFQRDRDSQDLVQGIDQAKAPCRISASVMNDAISSEPRTIVT